MQHPWSPIVLNFTIKFSLKFPSTSEIDSTISLEKYQNLPINIDTHENELSSFHNTYTELRKERVTRKKYFHPWRLGARSQMQTSFLQSRRWRSTNYIKIQNTNAVFSIEHLAPCKGRETPPSNSRLDGIIAQASMAQWTLIPTKVVENYVIIDDRRISN